MLPSPICLIILYPDNFWYIDIGYRYLSCKGLAIEDFKTKGHIHQINTSTLTPGTAAIATHYMFNSFDQLSEYIRDFSTEIYDELVQRTNIARRIPFHINFENDEINEVLNDKEKCREKSSEEKDPTQIRIITEKLFRIVSSEERNIEKDIFSAIMFYNSGKHGLVANAGF